MKFADFTPLDDHPERFNAPPGPEKDAFEALYQRWEDEINAGALSNQILPSWAFVGPTYREIGALGKPATPFIMEKIAHGNFLLNWTLEDITAVSPPVDVRRCGEQAVSRWWLARWELAQMFS